MSDQTRQRVPQLPPGHYEAHTRRFNQRVNVLKEKVQVGVPFDPSESPPDRAIEVDAIWDTGATHTAITANVAEMLELPQIGLRQCHTASGMFNARVYLVSILLPNGVGLPQIQVHEASLAGADVLLGMDIIGHGDFAVTNHQGKTTLTFRLPSMECLDFVRDKPKHRSDEGPKRNDPCPCGSGKKYKVCCGK